MITDNIEGSALGLVLNIIQRQMDLNPEQVLLYNQKWNLPPNVGIHVTGQFLGANPISNRSIVEDRGAGGFVEVQDSNFQEMYQIKIMSRDDSALFNKHKVLMALASVYSQQIQEENSFMIAPISSSFVDISEVEGTAILFAYAITITVHAWYRIERAVDFYDRFPGEVWTERNTGDNAITFEPTEPV